MSWADRPNVSFTRGEKTKMQFDSVAEIALMDWGGAPPINNEDPSGCGLWYSPSKCRFLGDFYKQFTQPSASLPFPWCSKNSGQGEREGIGVGGNRQQVQKPPGKVIHQKHLPGYLTPENSPTFIDLDVFGGIFPLTS